MSKGFKRATIESIEGTSLKGYLRVTYATLVRVFGTPGRGDGYKVDVEWRLKFDDGTIASIYNYKTGKAYLGEEGKPVSKITNWHVGGKSTKAIRLVREALKGKR